MLYFELPTAFPCYQKKEYQNRFRQNVAGRPDLPGGFKAIDLLCPFDALLPFEFYLPEPRNTAIVPTTWGIYKESDDSLVQSINLNLLNSTFLPGENRKYFYHDGSQQSIHLGTGAYYWRMDFPNGFKEYSEIFQVCNFSVNQLDCPFLKLEWWNDSDLNPIFYNDKVNGRPRFTNVVYLDTFIHEYEPEIVEETKPGGQGTAIPTFTRGNMRYRIAVVVPGYLKKALVFSQMHDHIFLTTAGVEHRTGELEKLTTSTETVLNGAFTNLEMVFEENFLIKTSCSNNMV